MDVPQSASLEVKWTLETSSKNLFANLRLCAFALSWYEVAFITVMVVALGLRLFELSGRTMHYDEAIHLHFSFKLANSPGGALGWPWIFGTDYFHSAWMHGPFQIEMAAAIFTILGDSDFTSRLGYALFGTALVGLPWFLRDHIGRRGALIAAVMLALSPALLYFSRFGRNDIIMMFWAVALFTLMWRYLHSQREPAQRRIYLYIASAVLAFMFATKETAYLLVAIFGFIVFLAALPGLWDWVRGRAELVREGSETALFLLLITLTLPQWSAIIGLFQGLLGLTLANPDPLTGNNVLNADGSKGLTGAPAWQGGALLVPVAGVPWPAHAAAIVAGLAVLVWLLSRGPLNWQRVSGLIALPLASVFACAWLIFRPYSGLESGNLALQTADWTLFAFAVLVAAAFAWWSRLSLGKAALLVLVPIALTALYSVLFTPVLDVQVHSQRYSARQLHHQRWRSRRARQLRRRPDNAPRHAGHIRGPRHLVAGPYLADMRRHLLRHLGGPLHHSLHQLGRHIHWLMAGHGILDCPAGRGPRQPALVLLLRRSLGLRAAAFPLRHRRSGLFLPP